MGGKQYTAPETCDRFIKCSANICPLAENWRELGHLAGERVCFYLIEAEKINAEVVFRDSGRWQPYLAIKEVSREIASCHYPIKYALEQAKKTGSRMARKIGQIKNGA